MNIFENCKNSKIQGTIGLGIAIQELVKKGYLVSLPINDSQEYDLIFDDGKLNKVSVKTTSYKTKHGYYNFNLSTKGGNRSYNTIKKFNNDKCDYVFVVTGEETKYLIPSKDITGKNCLTLYSPWDKFKI